MRNTGMWARLCHVMARMKRASEFTCADCERAYRCGTITSEACDFRTEQIARGDWKARRRVNSLARAIPWG